MVRRQSRSTRGQHVEGRAISRRDRREVEGHAAIDISLVTAFEELEHEVHVVPLAADVRLVEAQPGWIWVDAIDGRGTSISMTLPVAIETPDAERPAPASLAMK